MKALFEANFNNLYLIFQIKPYFVLYQCFMNTTVQNTYNIWCKVLHDGNLDGLKEMLYYSSGYIMFFCFQSFRRDTYFLSS